MENSIIIYYIYLHLSSLECKQAKTRGERDFIFEGGERTRPERGVCVLADYDCIRGGKYSGAKTRGGNRKGRGGGPFTGWGALLVEFT